MGTKARFSDQLRAAIAESGQSRYRIAKETGVAEPVLCRFCNHKVGLSMETVDTLCEYLGLRLVPDRPSKRKGR
jgi:hypothetical protein